MPTADSPDSLAKPRRGANHPGAAMEESGGFMRSLTKSGTSKPSSFALIVSVLILFLLPLLCWLELLMTLLDAIELREEKIIDEELLLLRVFCAAAAEAATDDTDEIACIVFSSLAAC